MTDEVSAAHRRDMLTQATIREALIALRELEPAFVGRIALADIQICLRTLEHESAAIVTRWN